MPKLFILEQTDDDEQEPTYREVELSEVFQAEDFELPEDALPEEIVKKHPTFKKQLDETVKQRKRYKEARDALQRLSQVDEGDEGDEDEDGQEDKPTPQNPVDPEVLAEQVFAKLQEKQSAQARAQQALEEAISGNIKKYNLPDNKETRKALALVGVDRVEELAQSMSAAGLNFEDAGARNPGQGDDPTGLSDADAELERVTGLKFS